MRTKEELLKEISEGNYRITYREHCECKVEWKVVNFQLVSYLKEEPLYKDELCSDECYICKELFVGKQLCAMCLKGNTVPNLLQYQNDISSEDLPKEVLEKLTSHLVSTLQEYSYSNSEHTEKQKASLIEFLSRRADNGLYWNLSNSHFFVFPDTTYYPINIEAWVDTFFEQNSHRIMANEWRETVYVGLSQMEASAKVSKARLFISLLPLSFKRPDCWINKEGNIRLDWGLLHLIFSESTIHCIYGYTQEENLVIDFEFKNEMPLGLQAILEENKWEWFL